MDPTKYDLEAVKKHEVRYYHPGESLCVSEWCCENCQEFIGYDYMDNTHAKICDNPVECPHSPDWDGSACGYVICEWCHEPAVERYRKWTDEESVEKIAQVIGLDEEVSRFD